MNALLYVVVIAGAVNLFVLIVGLIRTRNQRIDRIATGAYHTGLGEGYLKALRDFRAQQPYADRMLHLARFVRQQEHAARERWQ